ncbi:MAG TPA: glyoxylate/hydroxypyruvate reductase A, partial [Rhodospirillaceae bacterium]|nr:glyoxylate/hydroxypyruvate reductase A [Rhodospirillaceae bacterium]
MVLLFISGFHRPQGWQRLLAEELPDLDFRVWADET